MLLTGTDDERTERNKLRLEAIGVEFDTTLKTDISEIVPGEVNAEVDPTKIDKTSSGYPDKAARPC